MICFGILQSNLLIRGKVSSRSVICMPRKIRQLVTDLEKAGFINKGGKGSHRNYKHPKGMRVTISGKIGDDAKPYQEKEVKIKIEESRDE